MLPDAALALIQPLLFPPTRVNNNKLNRKLAGKTVVITGASYGIGEALALQLAGTGAHLVLIARTREKLEALQNKLETKGCKVTILSADLSKPEEVTGVAAELNALPGGVDVFVNNAGRSIRRSIYDSLDRFHDFSRLMSVNYSGPVQLLLAMIPIMEKNGGHVINVSTVSLLLPPAPYWAAYQSSKAAFDNWLQSAAGELRVKGMKISSIYFPLVRTRMIEPTEAYTRVPALSADHAARWIMKAISTGKKRVRPWWTTFAQLIAKLLGQHWERIAMKYVQDK